MRKNKKIKFDNSDNLSSKTWLKDIEKISYNYRSIIVIDPFIENNKDKLVFLYKTYEQSNMTLKKKAFSVFASEVINPKNTFPICKIGYGIDCITKRGSDIVMLSSEMDNLSMVLNNYGYKIRQSDYVWLDYEDLKIYAKFRNQGLSWDTKNSISSFNITPTLYKQRLLNETDLLIEKYKKNNIENATESEKTFENILKSLNIKYEFQKIIVAYGEYYIMDFYLNDYNVCIEIDGKYHKDIEQIRKDVERQNNMAKVCILTIRYDDEDVLSKTYIIKGELAKLFGKDYISPFNM